MIVRYCSQWTLVAVIFLSGSEARAQRSAAANSSNYLVPSTLSFWERTLLGYHGNRLQVPGAERFMYTGQLTRANTAADTVVVTRELPDKIRIDQVSQPGKPLILNGGNPGNRASLSDSDKDLLESFYADSPDQFFLGKSQGGAYRMIGGRVRTDDGKAKNYAGPWYQIHQVMLPVKYRGETGIRVKAYSFDATTGLLAAVSYQLTRSGAIVRVVIEYSGWRNISGQLAPTAIRRLENGSESWRFIIATAAFSALADDLTFKLQ